MSLDRAQIVDAAATMLAEGGLAGLSMRRLAAQLGVQPGALYHHVESKQELLAAVGEHVLSVRAGDISTEDPARAAADIRAALLGIRDGAEVISFVYAYRPEALTVLSELHRSFAPGLAGPGAHRAAAALIHHVLGFVAVEQNRAELVRARLLEAAPAFDAAFTAEIAALLAGLSPGSTPSPGG